MITNILRLVLLSILLLLATPSLAKKPRKTSLNIIDRCWRKSPTWWTNRQQLATCSVGFVGKMTNNIGQGLTPYTVTDPSDDPINPKFGTLRYGATKLGGKVWITFERDMHIKLHRKLMVNSFTTIDGRGVEVHITGGAGFVLNYVNNVIIHGIHFHDIHPQAQGPVLVQGPQGPQVLPSVQTDGDAIRLMGSSKVWIDHNTLSNCYDGLLDVTLGSTDVTISNNWFKNHDKVMLLGHDDSFVQDKNMKVTIVFNRFGPNCNQRMPRIRNGYAHIANNYYQKWVDYAIGGSSKPVIRSEGNIFVAPDTENKKVTWTPSAEAAKSWNWRSVRDKFVNGAFFVETGSGAANPRYNHEQIFRAANAKGVKSLTKSAGALLCSTTSKC